MKSFTLAVLVLALVGCVPVAYVSKEYTLAEAVTCRTADVSTWTGKTMPTVCSDGKNWQLVATPSSTARDAAVGVLQAGAVVGLGGLIGKGLSNAEFGTELSLEVPQVPYGD